MPGEARESTGQLHERLVAADRLAEAEAACREVRDASPQHADALNLLGMIAPKTGQLAKAESSFRAAPEGHNNLGESLRRAGRGEEAL